MGGNNMKYIKALPGTPVDPK
jgi:hypothetical protein